MNGCDVCKTLKSICGGGGVVLVRVILTPLKIFGPCQKWCKFSGTVLAKMWSGEALGSSRITTLAVYIYSGYLSRF